jgi:hypothetical protein
LTVYERWDDDRVNVVSEQDHLPQVPLPRGWPPTGEELRVSESYADELTTTDVDNFVGFMKFIANNDLWDEAKAALATAGVDSISISSQPIRVIREMINEELLPGDRLSGGNHRHALVISESHCGVGPPGPPGGPPVFPGGSDAGVPDATTLPPDGGG